VAPRRTGRGDSPVPLFAWEELVLIFSVDVTELPGALCTTGGVSEQIGAPAPLGATEQLSETGPLKPAREVMVTVAVAD